eukprot:scaffold163347_cov31-Prasinocladus_malaysianus.AAC.1
MIGSMAGHGHRHEALILLLRSHQVFAVSNIYLLRVIPPEHFAEFATGRDSAVLRFLAEIPESDIPNDDL